MGEKLSLAVFTVVDSQLIAWLIQSVFTHTYTKYSFPPSPPPPPPPPPPECNCILDNSNRHPFSVVDFPLSNVSKWLDAFSTFLLLLLLLLLLLVVVVISILIFKRTRNGNGRQLRQEAQK